MGSKANKGASSFLPNGYHTIWGDVLDLNEWQYHFVNTYVELAANRFSYNNLPESIDPRYMELSIMSTGSVCFFYDDILGYMALPGAWSGFVCTWLLSASGNSGCYFHVAADGSCRFGGADSPGRYRGMPQTTSMVCSALADRARWRMASRRI